MTEQVKKIIKDSGNNLHFEVVEILEKDNWKVEISPYYVDDLSDKPREVDIIARREIILDEFASPFHLQSKEVPTFWVILFIECKHLKDPVVFWMHENSRYKTALVSHNIELGNLWTSKEDQFHYKSFGDKIAKLYDTERNQENLVFNAITQPIKSLLFYKTKMPLKGVYYPLFIYGGRNGLYDETGNRREDMIVHLNYAYKANQFVYKSRDFYVDILHKDTLGVFLERLLRTEVNEIKKERSFDFWVSGNPQ